MSEQYPGGFISKTEPTVTTSSAQGMWTLSQQAGYQKQGLWPVPYVPDAQFNYVTMLLHGDGTNGAQNNTFLDSSTNNFTITRNGNTTQGSFSPYGANWSNYFVRSASSYITLSDSSAFSLGTSDFTVECWIFPTLSGSTQDISGQADSSITTTSRSFLLQINGSGNIIAGVWSGSTGYTITSSSAVSFNTWNHIALVRSSGTLTLYVNGVSAGTSSVSTASVNDSSNNLSIGRFGERNTAYYDGYVSNFRLVIGTAIYTANFTPSTTPLTAVSGTQLLTCADNRFIDDSTNNFAITVNGTPSVQRFNPFGTATAYSTAVIGGSGYFDGSGDYLSAPDNTAFEFGSGNFTIEAWAYPLDGGFQMLVAKSPDNQATGWQFFASGDELSFFASTGGSWNVGFFSSSAPIKRNAWNHLAVTRNGSTWTIWVNGVSQATTTSSITINNNTTPVFIGTFSNASYFSYGYTADVRIIKGTALYTSNFTPPTAPLTAITNTSLLTSFTNGAIFDNAMMNDLETVGNAQISTSVVKYGTGSIYINSASSGSYLTSYNKDAINFGTGDFTIEGWIYPTQYTNDSLICKFITGGNIFFVMINSGQFTIVTNGYSSPSLGYSFFGALSLNVWTHIALTRVSGTCFGYINGTKSGSSYSFPTAITPNQVIIGEDATNRYIGYIDDFRLTKGVARYTANFTPPTAAFQNTGPTV
jgi:hypothetical protein